MEDKERRIVVMKIMKTILAALIVGIVCLGKGFLELDQVSISEIILWNAFDGIEYYPQYISDFMFQYMPLFIFQILFSVNIYKHFCSASVYYFSRNINRIHWFLKEVAKMYVNAVIYLFVICVTEIVFICFFASITVDVSAVIIAIYYILIYSLFLLATTLAINVFSIIFSSNIGFITVQSVILLFISVFFMLGNYIGDGVFTEKTTLFLKGNMIANLIFSIHSSKIEKVNELIHMQEIHFDLNFSILYYLILSAGVLILGCYVVEKHEFIINSKELE